MLRLHPWLLRALERRAVRVVNVRAGERVKSLGQLEKLAAACRDVPRGSALLAVGGGTVGDLTTVLAHTFKRGLARFVQVPTTLLAAVDSSLGGKGAVNAAGAKNLLGVFHEADEAWLCPVVWSTLSAGQLREGRVEAFKMAVTLGAEGELQRSPASLEDLVRRARSLKAAVVRDDPYERTGLRAVLNFGHTFGHVLEAVSRYRVRHGEAVGMGILCALDVGVALRVTPREVRELVEEHLPLPLTARARMSQVLSAVRPAEVEQLLQADKKADRDGLKMILVRWPGSWVATHVDRGDWWPLLKAWRAGRRP